MKRLLLILFILTISLTTFQSVYSKNNELRMSVIGVWDGGKTDDTIEDKEDDDSKFLRYIIDKTCFEIYHIVFKGNIKNVTIKIMCSDGTELLSKSKVNIKGKYTLPLTSFDYNKCKYEKEGVQNTIQVFQNSNIIYSCDITSGVCEM